MRLSSFACILAVCMIPSVASAQDWLNTAGNIDTNSVSTTTATTNDAANGEAPQPVLMLVTEPTADASTSAKDNSAVPAGLFDANVDTQSTDQNLEFSPQIRSDNNEVVQPVLVQDETKTTEPEHSSDSALKNDVKRTAVDDSKINKSDKKDNKDSVVLGHGLGLSMSFVGVPSAIIDHWFDKHGNMWDGVADMGFALDYTLRFTFPMELRLSLSWTSLATGDAYWLEKDADPRVADYIENNLSVVSIEAAVYHVVPLVDNLLDFYYGGGLWGGVIVGDAKAYSVNGVELKENGRLINAIPHAAGYNEPTGLPPVIGFVMATVGLKFTFADMVTLRAEGGFKGYFYGQLGLGVQF